MLKILIVLRHAQKRRRPHTRYTDLRKTIALLVRVCYEMSVKKDHTWLRNLWTLNTVPRNTGVVGKYSYVYIFYFSSDLNFVSEKNIKCTAMFACRALFSRLYSALAIFSLSQSDAPYAGCSITLWWSRTLIWDCYYLHTFSAYNSSGFSLMPSVFEFSYSLYYVFTRDFSTHSLEAK